VCPNCGYLDNSHWRQNRWRTEVEFLELSDFQEENPELAKKLLDGHPYAIDKLHAYRLSGSKGIRIIERVWIGLFKDGGPSAFHIPRERHKPMDPYQKLILEAST
jgi:hypothetical protein